MEPTLTLNQGIVSVLTDITSRPPPSLRRTLSADMMSKAWLSQTTSIKKIASSQDLSRCISEHEEEEDDTQNPSEMDIWSLIVSQSQNKDQEQTNPSPPYIHPLVKKSSAALSKNSLRVCTESLGSETGSDGFSSEMGDPAEPEIDDEPPQQLVISSDDVINVVAKYNFAGAGKKPPPPPPRFPPPLPSLTSRADGGSLRVKPRRENGRLVIEAVSVSSQNNFKANRQNGRLVLTFRQSSDDGDFEEYEYEDEESEEIAQPTSGGAMKIHRLALTRNKPGNLGTKNTKFNKIEESVVKSVNEYEYSWREKPTTAQAMGKNRDNKYAILKKNTSVIENNRQWKAADNKYAVKGCKEHRRSLFREPYCIATS